MQLLASPLWRGVALLMGVTIGAGILGIPYAFSQVGLVSALLTFIVTGLVVLLCQLYLGEIALSTKQPHQLPGLAEIFLGVWGKRVVVFCMLLYIYGALLAYTLGAGDILSRLFGSVPFLWSLLFFLLCATIVYFGVHLLIDAETALTALTVFFIFTLFGWALPSVTFYNVVGPVSFSSFFYPFGIFLFAFLGLFTIPDLRVALRGQERVISRVILWTSVLVFVLYLLFALFVVGVAGTATSPVATLALGDVLGPGALWLGNFFALLAMATSFIALAYSVKHLYIYDYGFSKLQAFLCAISVPLLLFVLGFGHFISLLALGGALGGGLLLILVVIMHARLHRFSSKKSPYHVANPFLLRLLLILLLFTGMIWTLVLFFF